MSASKSQAKLLIHAGAKRAPNYKTDALYNQYHVEQWEKANPDLAAIWPKVPYKADITALPAKFRSNDAYDPYYAWGRLYARTEGHNANERWMESQGVYDIHWLTTDNTEAYIKAKKVSRFIEDPRLRHSVEQDVVLGFGAIEEDM